MRSTRLIIAALLLAAPLAGCLAPQGAAGIPQEALDDKGWREIGKDDTTLLRGAAKVFINEYEPKPGLVQTDFGGIHVVTTRAVPVVDEAEFVEPILERLAGNQGFTLGDRQRETFTVEDGRSVRSTVYDVEDAPANARLRVVPMSCPDADAFVAGIGWATKGHFDDVTELLGEVPCPA